MRKFNSRKSQISVEELTTVWPIHEVKKILYAVKILREKRQGDIKYIRQQQR